MNANGHPYKVVSVRDTGFYANTHPYKVVGDFGGIEVVDALPKGKTIDATKLYNLTKDYIDEGVVYHKGLYYYDPTEEEWKEITGGSGGKDTILVGLVNKNTAHLPSRRPDGSALIDGDYVKVDSNTTRLEDFPFTVDGITFTTMKDTAVRLGNEWIPNASPFQKTAETPLSDPEHESLSGEENMQDDVNKEFVNYVKNKKAAIKVSSLPTTNIKEDTLYILTTQKNGYMPGTYDYINGTWERIDKGDKLVDSANIDFVDGYTYYDYVETTGEQYFETDFIPADFNHKVEMYLGAAFLEAKDDMLHGTLDATKNVGYFLGCDVYNFCAKFANTTVSGNIQGSHPMVVGTSYTILTNTVGRTDGKFEFATIFPGSWWYIDFPSGYMSNLDESRLGSFILGGYKIISDEGTTYNLHKSRIYRLRVWEEIDGKAVLTHYYRPAKDSDGNPGMYDTQTGKFFKAKGTNLEGLNFSTTTYLSEPTALVKTVDELGNNSPIRPLSARQGRILDDKKLDKATEATEGERIYGKNADGTQSMYGLDNKTLKINTDNKLEALSKPIEEGGGINVEEYENRVTISAEVDDKTIIINDDGKLESVDKIVEQGPGIIVGEDEEKITVSAKVDNETIKTNSDDKLEVVTATEEAKGVVKPDSETIIIEDGIISVPVATDEIKGVVQPDGDSILVEDGVISIERENAYDTLIPVGNIDNTYLAYVEYSGLDYQYAKERLDHDAPAMGACSATIIDGKLVRNYDWTYSNSCEFVVRTPAINNRHAVIGVVGGVPTLTKDFVKSGEYSDVYKVVPFMLVDGQNDAGLKMNVNVVPNDKGPTVDTNPAGKEKINALMLVRWVLDHFATVEEVVAAVEEISIYVPQLMRDMGYELHFLISDKTTTKVLEFVDNACVWKNHNTITNFYIDGVSFKTGGTVPRIGDVDIASHGLTDHAQGLERYNLIVGHAGTPFELLRTLRYTMLYSPTSNRWYSELCGGNITISSPMTTFDSALTIAIAKYNTRTRDAADTWQTVHSVIYENDKMTVYTQENYTNGFSFDTPKGVTSSWLEITNKPFETLSTDLTVESNALKVKKATAADFGTVKPDGQTTRINETTGLLEAVAPVPAEFVEGDGIDLIPNPETGEVIIATKVDEDTITFDGDGKMKAIANGHEPDETTITLDADDKLKAITATSNNKGIVKPDGETITIENGVISAVTATTDNKGIVKPDGETITIENGVISAKAAADIEAGEGINVTTEESTTTISAKVDSETIDTNDGGQLYAKASQGIQSSTLPEGYTQLEYIEATGSQYIDTGVSGQITGFEAKVDKTSLAQRQTLFGVYDNLKGLYILYTEQDSKEKMIYVSASGSNTEFITSEPYVLGVKNVAYHYSGGTSTYSVNGNVKSISATPPTITAGVYFYLFASHKGSDGPIYNYNGKLYSCKIWQSDGLKRDFIPARRESDGEIGLYDIVGNTFYENKGTGDFTAGPEYYAAFSFGIVSPDGVSTRINPTTGKLESIASVPDITAGDGIAVEGTKISAKIDNTTIKFNGDGQLTAVGGGGGTADIEAGTGIVIGEEGGGLPTGYKRLEWLGSKTSWVKTGVIPTMNTSAEITVRMPQVPSSGPSNVFGVVDTNRFYAQYSYSGAAWNAYFGTTANTAHLAPCYTDKVNISISAAKVKIYDYDTKLSDETTDPYTGTFTVSKEIWLCGVNGSSSGSRVNTRWYDCKIWESGVLTHHYVPAQRESDSVIGFYDMVEDEFMTPETTAGFEAGPEYAGTKKVNVKIDNETISVNANNELVATSNGYEPDGETITLNTDEKLEAVKASSTSYGIVQPDNDTIKIDEDGKLVATSNGYEPDGESIILNDSDKLQTNNIIWRTL